MVRAAIAPAKDAPFQIDEVVLDEPREGEVLVKIAGTGICHSDIAAVAQELPFALPGVLGHEGAGIVAAIGPGVSKVQPGDPVVLTFGHCGECANCTSGNPAYCMDFGPCNAAGVRLDDGSSCIHRDGEALSSFFFGQSSFADHALARQNNVVKIDRDVPLEIMGALGCGIQTGAGAIMRSLDVRPGSSLLVTGGGTVGLSGVMAAAVRECSTIIVSEPHEERRKLAERLGATHTFDPRGKDLDAMVREIVPEGVDYAFDTTARPDIISTAIDSLALRGKIGLVGVAKDPETLLSTNMMAAIGKGITIRGICEGDSDPDVFIPELVALFKEGRFPLDKLCKTYPLEDINRAVEEQAQGLCVKPILIP